MLIVNMCGEKIIKDDIGKPTHRHTLQFINQVQLGVARPSRHFSRLWQNCLLAPPDVQLISQVQLIVT